jgi:single-strand DNA-binding protein
MSRNTNAITLTGNCTRAPELRFTASGKATASFGLAVNRSWKRDDEWVEEVSFFDVTCWGQLAENTAESIEKGTRLIVTGRLDQRTWENQEGQKRSKVELVADEIGAAMSWATVTVTKNERHTPNEPSERSGGRTAASGGSTYAGPQEEEPFAIEMAPDPTRDRMRPRWQM